MNFDEEKKDEEEVVAPEVAEEAAPEVAEEEAAS